MAIFSWLLSRDLLCWMVNEFKSHNSLRVPNYVTSDRHSLKGPKVKYIYWLLQVNLHFSGDSGEAGGGVACFTSICLWDNACYIAFVVEQISRNRVEKIP